MTEMTRAQLLKLATKAMADVNVNSTPLKVIGREACLRDKGHFLGYQRIMDPKGIQTFEGRNNQRK